MNRSTARLAAAATAVTTSAVLALASPALALEGSDHSGEACPPSLVPTSSFTDIEGNTHEARIDCLAWYGIAQGSGSARYAPAETMRRDQVASLLARTLDHMRVELPESEDRFRDLDGNVHRDNIERLAAAGVLNGTAPGLYSPAAGTTRAQLASMLWRALELSWAYGSMDVAVDYFSDDDQSLHQRNINRSYYWGMVEGRVPPVRRGQGDEFDYWERGLYGPQDLVRRDQMASFVARLLANGVLFGPGGRANPYATGAPVLLQDGWELTYLGGDDNASAEVKAAHPDNTVPDDHTLMLFRVRATYRGTGTSTFDGAERLKGGAPGYTPSYLGGDLVDASGRPCGDIPFELPNPEVSQGETIEGNLCFAFPGASPPTQDNYLPMLVDTFWDRPTQPHLAGEPVGAVVAPTPSEQLAPYAPPAVTR